MRPLTARQSRFVNAYVAGVSSAEAARKAGYWLGYAAKAAKYLLHHPSIAAAIQELRKQPREVSPIGRASITRRPNAASWS